MTGRIADFLLPMTQPGVPIIIIIISPHFAASRQGLDCVGDLSDRDLSQTPVRESAGDQ
jgi:hypothetical protein